MRGDSSFRPVTGRTSCVVEAGTTVTVVRAGFTSPPSHGTPNDFAMRTTPLALVSLLLATCLMGDDPLSPQLSSIYSKREMEEDLDRAVQRVIEQRLLAQRVREVRLAPDVVQLLARILDIHQSTGGWPKSEELPLPKDAAKLVLVVRNDGLLLEHVGSAPLRVRIERDGTVVIVTPPVAPPAPRTGR